MKKIKIAAAILYMAALLSCISCGSTDISGYYTCTGMDSVYNFTSDGKIIVNDETESYSRYKVSGNKITTYIEGAAESEMEFKFKKTDDGFMMGELEYIKMKEYNPEQE